MELLKYSFDEYQRTLTLAKLQRQSKNFVIALKYYTLASVHLNYYKQLSKLL